MDCKHCKYPESRVVETRQQDNDSIYRRRECVRCGERFTTYEQVRDNGRPLDDRFPNRKPLNGEHYR
jgi:transcriptional regulator NrdR family protein